MDGQQGDASQSAASQFGQRAALLRCVQTRALAKGGNRASALLCRHTVGNRASAHEVAQQFAQDVERRLELLDFRVRLAREGREAARLL
eukprot:6041492-Prymnesium_polylepis.1